jgi:hypothetical protein
MNHLEEVFKISGIPTYTFVRPLEFSGLLVALRTAGRGVMIEGPSGIGKTTAVTRALDELGIGTGVTRLSARRPGDLPAIADLPSRTGFGVVIIDDFHRLPAGTRTALADFMKLLADEERPADKVVLIGINKAGQALIRFAPDLNNRLDVIQFEANPDEKVQQLVMQGEAAINVSVNIKDEIVVAAHGSFYIAQMLCHQACLESNILEERPDRTTTTVSLPGIQGKVHERLARTFMKRTKRFARGTRFRREGRAPYLHLLHWLAESQEWSLNIDQSVAAHPSMAGSITQIVEKGYLAYLIEKDEEISSVLHLDTDARVLSVEDPQYMYFLRSLSWSKFPAEVGFLAVDIPSRYDFALSFAGADRPIASCLHAALEEMEFEVFYDHNEQHRILAEDVEDYLRPIYQSDADFVVALLGPEYPKRIWTKFESESFKARFKDGTVIPVWFKTAPPGMFDESTRVGGVEFDPDGDVAAQIHHIAELLSRKIAEKRVETTAVPGIPGEQLPLRGAG